MSPFVVSKASKRKKKSFTNLYSLSDEEGLFVLLRMWKYCKNNKGRKNGERNQRRRRRRRRKKMNKKFIKRQKIIRRFASLTTGSTVGRHQIFNFFKTGRPRPLLLLFSSFQTNITILTTNICEKISIQYMVLGFELTAFGTRVSSQNH